MLVAKVEAPYAQSGSKFLSVICTLLQYPKVAPFLRCNDWNAPTRIRKDLMLGMYIGTQDSRTTILQQVFKS